ncbi:hypothetical protein [Caballeronia zhejiangensis]|uniref:hypothetical protein n=1 Tax=Caballeronia zhejiangensis TaxID=871203 RepID=UPI00158D9F4F|nr:hypothetical protein [Caballeronia zhejiangensis]MCG7402991.1 hypothetical protein [Caballeronia zhejiangensis]MCI1043816.1 hypothetical protein [Caballeronia zhejiangensis]
MEKPSGAKSDKAMREMLYEAYELAYELSRAAHAASRDSENAVVPRSKLQRLLAIVPLIASYAFEKMSVVPLNVKAEKRRTQQMQNADPILCCLALAKILKHVDYTGRACNYTEQVGAILPVEVIWQARAALNANKEHQST